MYVVFINKSIKLLNRNRFLAILLLITFLFRLPSLFEPFWYGDEAIYLVIGKKILHGGLLYVDIFDHKTPGIYYLAAASLKLFGETIWSFRFMLMLWVLTTLVVYFTLSKKLFDIKIARVSTIVLAALTATPLLEGNIGNSEILMILPICLGFIFGLNKKYFWSGLFFSLAIMIKFPAFFDFAAFGFWLILFSGKELLRNLKSLVLLSLGYITPILASLVFFAWKGALQTYIYSALLFNFSYTNYGNQLKFGSLTVPYGLVVLKTLPLVILVVYFAWRLFAKTKFRVGSFELVLLWLAFSYYGASFGGRPYTHYLIQALPAFSILIGITLVRKNLTKISAGIVIGLVVLTLALGFKPYIN
ncbi:MAG: glycosyltransferase family 39 protein, partial [Candidatus Magasanikbacteria bacterium]|nr:glycosyltransferase family 39 protein [Candidatus Magasanikbacteria bacterium]